MKKWKLSLVAILGGLAAVLWLLMAHGRTNADLKIVSFGDWGMELVNISIQRRLVSISQLPADFQLWVPGGYGWYEAGRIGKLLAVAGEDERLVSRILFFNFGLVADRVAAGDGPGEWRKRRVWMEMANLGWWWNWELSRGTMLEKNELLGEFFGERMEREYANIDWLSLGNSRWVVVNRSGMAGLAAMVSQRLEWSGVWVSGVANDAETNTNCKIKRAAKLIKIDEEIVDSINKILGCDVEIIDDENMTEVVVELGGGWGQMIKYDNYVRSF